MVGLSRLDGTESVSNVLHQTGTRSINKADGTNDFTRLEQGKMAVPSELFFRAGAVDAQIMGMQKRRVA
jgi:hypothetical protein